MSAPAEWRRCRMLRESDGIGTIFPRLAIMTFGVKSSQGSSLRKQQQKLNSFFWSAQKVLLGEEIIWFFRNILFDIPFMPSTKFKCNPVLIVIWR